MAFRRHDVALTRSSEGVATIGIGSIGGLFLPEFPYNARMLTPIERDMAVWRIEKEAGAGEGHEDVGTWAGFVIGLKDVKVSSDLFLPLLYPPVTNGSYSYML